MSLQYNGKKWVSVVDCHHCKKQILAKEGTIISIDYNYSGTKGKTYVNLCKECNRDHQLNKLIK